MYWPIKACFGLIVLGVLGGGVYFAWPHLPFGKTDERTPVTENGTPTATPNDTTTAHSGGDGGTTLAATTNSRKLAKYSKNLQLATSMVQNDPVKARKIIEQILKDPALPKFSDAWNQVALTLTKANRQILFTDIPAPEKKIYIVQAGNSLERIARRFRTCAEVIAKAHGINAENPIIRIGQTLRVWEGHWNIEISKSTCMLLLKDGDRLIMAYRIGLGKQNRTPLGKFQVAYKQKNPDWYRNGRKYAFGTPDNPLGTRWIALKGTEDRTRTKEGYGIHGTKDPDSIGKYESNGCARMINNEVEELYSVLPRSSTPVLLVP